LSTVARAHRRLLSGLPTRCRIYELAARDGLQNEPKLVDTPTKVEFINRLSRIGAAVVETTSFVSAKAVPQMADGAAVLAGIDQLPGVEYPVLVLNLKGFELAREAGATSIAIMTVPSATFAHQNNNCTPDETVRRAEAIALAATEAGVRVRGYVSCALGCPFEGPVAPAAVAAMAERLHAAGCYEVRGGAQADHPIVPPSYFH